KIATFCNHKNHVMPITFLINGLAALLLFAQPAPPADEALVAYYSFNDCTARDDTGYGSDGILYGNPGCWCGVDDDGLLLDGVDDYVAFTGRVNKYFNTSDFTVSFYFKPEQYLVFRQSLLSKRQDCESYNMMDIALDLNKREVATDVMESPNKYYPGISPALDTTRWVHFALSREGTRAYTYINGRLAKRGFRCSGVDISNAARLALGNSPCIQTGRTRRFRGVIDELRVYDRALTEEEIWQLYQMYPVEHAAIDCVT
ncbi:MAG TPA: LamG domain-containing protein, partial [Phaeodactylibacter sp.]|nr:LamG domain-containing protein [Phaeodactylibacter sp.]